MKEPPQKNHSDVKSQAESVARAKKDLFALAKRALRFMDSPAGLLGNGRIELGNGVHIRVESTSPYGGEIKKVIISRVDKGNIGVGHLYVYDGDKQCEAGSHNNEFIYSDDAAGLEAEFAIAIRNAANLLEKFIADNMRRNEGGDELAESRRTGVRNTVHNLFAAANHFDFQRPQK